MENEILKAIDELLGESEMSDPSQVVETTTWPPTAVPGPSRPPRVGTIVQRGDREQQVKRAMLLQPPPPPPKRRPAPASPPEEPAMETQPGLLMLTGPTPPPPIRCQVAPGIVFEVPHFAVHTSRRYKVRSTEHGYWILRFSKRGELRYTRRIRCTRCLECLECRHT